MFNNRIDLSTQFSNMSDNKLKRMLLGKVGAGM